MQLWYSFSLVLILYCCDFQMVLSMLKAYLALLIRFLMSLSAPPTFVTILPRYVNSLVVLRTLPFTWIVGCGFVMLKAIVVIG